VTRRARALCFLAGVLTVPTGTAAVVLWLEATTPGLEVTCRVCGYSTGPRRRTPRWQAETRWLWHRHVTRRLGHCQPEPRQDVRW